MVKVLFVIINYFYFNKVKLPSAHIDSIFSIFAVYFKKTSIFFTHSENQLKAFKDLLATPKKVVITCHQNPDGDAMGSTLGLYWFLTEMGHEAQVISPTEVPFYLSWMPGTKSVFDFENHSQTAAAEKSIGQADLIFCLDFSAANRLKNAETPVLRSSALKVMVDHHQQPEDFADYMYWNVAASSTCELIYQLIKDLNGSMSKNTAICLYTGLMTDTGSFRFDATTPEVHMVAADLLRHGAVPAQIHRSVFDTNSIERLKLVGYCLAEKLVYLPEYRTAYFSLTSADLERFSSKSGDTEGLVNYALSLTNVVFAAIFIDKKDLIKISFRSFGSFSVSEFSRQHFSGGGHHNAAGGKSTLTLEETLKKFQALLPTYKNQLEIN